MRFGLLQEGLLDAGTDGHRRYHEMVEEAVIAEEAGFDFYANSEQHFIVTPDLVSVSSPEVFLTYVAARTSRIRLRTASTVLLEFNHPVRVAERLATLDVLSGGRAELGTARSNNVNTLEAFGVDPTTTRAQWTESIQRRDRVPHDRSVLARRRALARSRRGALAADRCRSRTRRSTSPRPGPRRTATPAGSGSAR